MESPVIKNVRYWLLLRRCSRDGPVEMLYFEGLFDLLTGNRINLVTAEDEELAVFDDFIGHW